MRLPKKLALWLTAVSTTLIVDTSVAGPRVAGGDMTFSGTVGITETSRVNPNANSSSDTIFQFTPAISYERESSRMNLRASLSAPIQRYDSNAALDSNSIRFDLGGELPFGNGPKLSGNWGVSYFDGIQASFFTNRNLETTDFSVSAFADYILQRRLSFRTRATYEDRDNNDIFGNPFNANTSTTFAAGLHARDLIKGRIGLYAEYVIQNRETNLTDSTGIEGIDDSDDGVNFGITGQLLPERLFPKLEADLSFGFNSTSTSDRLTTNRDRDGEERLTLNGRLAYPANPRTNVVLTYNRNLSITDDDRTVERSEFLLSLDYTPRQKLTFATSIGISSNDFIFDNNSRKDDILTAAFSSRYSIRSNWFATFSINHRDTSSNEELSDFDSTQITLSSTIQY